MELEQQLQLDRQNPVENVALLLLKGKIPQTAKPDGVK